MPSSSPDLRRRLETFDRAARRTNFNRVPVRPRKPRPAWTMEAVARSAAHSLPKALKRVGIAAQDAAAVALWDVYRSDAAAAAGTIQFPKAHRFRAAKNEILNLIRDERRHHRQRDEKFFDRQDRQPPHGVWTSAYQARRDAHGQTGPQDPATVYALQEVMEMIGSFDRELFRLHVLEGYSLGKTALQLGVRKETVVVAWRALRAELRTLLIESGKQTC